MTRYRFALLVAATLSFSSNSLAQTLPTGSDGDSGWVAMGDMLIPAQSNSIDPRVGKQASIYPADVQFRPLAWSLGIVPIAFGPEVSADRQEMFWSACALWQQAGPIVCIPRTVESNYVLVRASGSTGCGASVGSFAPSVFNFSLDWCWNIASVAHDFGHNLGFIHEHQRPDRDRYVTVDLANVQPGFLGAYTIWGGPVVNSEAYDFNSLMHYPPIGYAIDNSKPTIVVRPEFADAARQFGVANRPSSTDLAFANSFYQGQLKTYGAGRATLPVQTRFDRNEFLGALFQLNAIYVSSLGLRRPNGLSIDGRPDFLGIATWIFDVYLGARSAGFDRVSALDVVVAAITQTEEWRLKHPGQRALTPAAFTPYLSLDRGEFLSALNRLDNFYSSQEGLQRPNGLSLNGGPDLSGIATWIFDVYLNQRLTGGSPNAAWVAVENAIKATDEWKRKH